MLILLKKGYHKKLIFFSLDSLLINNLSSSENFNDSENKKIQQQIIHEIYPSVIKESMIISFSDPSFFENSFKFNKFFLPPETPLNVETTLKYQKRDSLLKVVYKWITENSRPVAETPVKTASPPLLEQ